eukprot:TRINITY_DN21366_c0_g1_i1.p2 TRINITY_DN21366_c0_g1~~TRINITY_DN21366_c0_g1_i1.p2  ORF type:complete len:114 (-),score=58.70 TRINITY_DN21366_c0_g1_i1:28-369(-)
MFPGDDSAKKGDPMAFSFAPGNTYSMSFHGKNLDFFQWKSVNVPGLRDLDLSTFWAQLPVRLVAYELEPGPKGLAADMDSDHTQSRKHYFFNFELQHDNNTEVTAYDADDSDE